MTDAPGAGELSPRQFAAYLLPDRAPLPLVPAEARVEWMDATRFHNANHCLPLLMANQYGWWLLNTHDFQAVWDGGDDASSMRVRYRSTDPSPYPAGGHFGYGLLTLAIPYVFRTPPGWNLLCRGPANRPKDGASALEGLIETDWTSSSFTMSWKLTRPDHPVTFRRGEPICLLVPQRRGDLESLGTSIEAAAGTPVGTEYRQWSDKRLAFKEAKDPAEPSWQHDYLVGKRADGTTVREHQRRLHLKPFDNPGADSGS